MEQDIEQDTETEQYSTIASYAKELNNIQNSYRDTSVRGSKLLFGNVHQSMIDKEDDKLDMMRHARWTSVDGYIKQDFEKEYRQQSVDMHKQSNKDIDYLLVSLRKSFDIEMHRLKYDYDLKFKNQNIAIMELAKIIDELKTELLNYSEPLEE